MWCEKKEACVKEAVRSYPASRSRFDPSASAGVRRRCNGRELSAMAVEFPEVEGHPNRLPFEDCLTLVDVPSRCFGRNA